jgi:hypothetical protein
MAASGTTLRDWLRTRIPDVPPPLATLLTEERAEEIVDPDFLHGRALESLERSLDSPGRNRQAAYHLLAGDAFLTYACEALAREPEPGMALEGLLRTLGEELA